MRIDERKRGVQVELLIPDYSGLAADPETGLGERLGAAAAP
jgi:hypothetical protein